MFKLLSRVRPVLAALAVLSLGTMVVVAQPGGPRATLLASGLEGPTIGSTVGPDGALYVAEAVGRIARVDPTTGAVSTFASGLPPAIHGIGGPIDVAFLDETAYVLVTLVSPGVGGTAVDGIYRVDGPNRFTVIADIGAFAIAHPPHTSIESPSGLQFAMEPYRGGFLVTDGNHNRVYQVTLDGTVTEFIAFPDIVPTGLEVRGNKVYMAEAGPIPHLPQDGKIVSFGPMSPVTTVAAGARLLVGVGFGPSHHGDEESGGGHGLYGLSQGFWNDTFPGTPAEPNTGSLVKANVDGTFTVIVGGLDRPTSFEFIGKTAYVVTLTGEVWKIDLDRDDDSED
jgi:hypothetical protein